MNFAFKLDDRAATEELVNGLAAALAEDDKEEANRLMYEAQEKIENLPDRMIGLSEMHDYGYRNDDMLPLMKEAALEWHRAGEKIYPLFRMERQASLPARSKSHSMTVFSVSERMHGRVFCWNSRKTIWKMILHIRSSRFRPSPENKPCSCTMRGSRST